MSPPFTIAHYRVTSKLGEGGMGAVYRATDSKLGREVAIKMIPEAFTADPDRLARFTREAQVLASLNHPNIAAIYGTEERALVLELVEGPTLEERIAQGPIPMDEALAIARQIAEGLEYAHERGVVHRDLKPANIKLAGGADGSGPRVKVLDFGLAKSLANEPPTGDPEVSPTLTMRATMAGTIMGTAAYMSAEQARGQAVDRRADIWAFGAVLFEMLTGRRAFAGSTIADTLAAVLNSEPDYALCPANLPPRIGYLLKRCLRKKVSERLRDIGEARIWIDEAETEPVEPEQRGGGGRRWMWMVAAAMAAVGIGAGAYFWRVSKPASPVWTGTFLGGPSGAAGPRISPDGKTLAFGAMVDGQFQVAVMKPETGNWTVLTRERMHGPVTEIAWSPDGTRLYFSRVLGSLRAVYSVPVLGGDERLVLDNASAPEMLPDSSLLVVKIDSRRRLQVHHFWPESGKLEPLKAEVELDDTAARVRAFPDGKEAVYMGWPIEGQPGDVEALYALDLQTGKSRRLAQDVTISPQPQEIGYPMAVTADGKKVLVCVPEGDMRALVAVPRHGKGAETWMNLTQDFWFLDAGPDGSLYMDQVSARPEALRFAASGGVPEHLLSGIALGPVLAERNGSLLASSIFAGRRRVAVLRPGSSLTPVSETREEMGTTITSLGGRAVAFALGPRGKMAIGIASLPDGRIVRRIAVAGGVIDELASSPDGARIFYVSAKKVWSVPAEGGDAKEIADADSVAVGLDEIMLEVNANDGFHLLRLPLAGGAAAKIGLSGGLALTGADLHPTAVRPDGRVLISVNEPDRWYYSMAMADRKTGAVRMIPAEYDGDIWYPGWTHDGKIIATGVKYSFGLWQMRR